MKENKTSRAIGVKRAQEIVREEKWYIPATIGAYEAARLLGYPARTFEGMVNKGILPQPDGRGAYDPLLLVKAHADHIRGDKAKRRIEEARAKKLERENRLATKKIISIDVFSVGLMAAIAAFKQGGQALPGRLSGMLAGKSAEEIREVVRREYASIIASVRRSVAEAVGEASDEEVGKVAYREDDAEDVAASRSAA